MSVLTARGVGIRRGRHQWLFRDVDVTVEPGDRVAIVGPPGSGRTTLLLALAKRFRLDAGRVDGGRTALGHVPGVTSPEAVLTVTEHVRERLALLGRRGAVDLRGLGPRKRGMDLTPYEKQVLGLILAGLSRPELIALDGLDDGLTPAEQDLLWEQMVGEEAAVVISAREIDPARVTTVITLGEPE